METWLKPDLMLRAAEAIDRATRLPQADRTPILELAQHLHEEYSKMCAGGVPSKLELDIMPQWAKMRGIRKPVTIGDVRKIMSAEIEKLLWIHTFGPFGNFESRLDHAKKFCLMLHRAALAVMSDEDQCCSA